MRRWSLTILVRLKCHLLFLLGFRARRHDHWRVGKANDQPQVRFRRSHEGCNAADGGYIEIEIAHTSQRASAAGGGERRLSMVSSNCRYWLERWLG